MTRSPPGTDHGGEDQTGLLFLYFDTTEAGLNRSGEDGRRSADEVTAMGDTVLARVRSNQGVRASEVDDAPD